jgi:hypothetical protein
MKKNIYYTAIIIFILSSYVLVGVVGFLETLAVFTLSNPQQIEQAKSGLPSATKVCWTQNKHIPSTIKIEVPSPVIFIEPETHQIQTYSILYTFGTVIIHLDPLVSLHSSRAPPLA